jgi:uncharacterized protein (TIGR00661 family)
LKIVLNPSDIVIIAPLNWGLGHASRCIPIINQLKNKVANVIIATDGLALDLLNREFPELTKYNIDNMEIKYPYSNMFLNAVVQLPSIVSHIAHDTKMAKRIVAMTGATVIISDNRFGFKDDNCKNIYITHQLHIYHPNVLVRFFTNIWHQRLIRSFDECWVPDFADDYKALAGVMSRSIKNIKLNYLGPITRIRLDTSANIDIDILIIISGPEPQRTKFEIEITDVLSKVEARKVLIRGHNSSVNYLNFETINLADSFTISRMLNQTKILICRSGYSSIMDIYSLGCKVIFVPTPGQSEQIYLSNYLSTRFPHRFRCVQQSELHLLPLMVDSLQ